MVYTMVTVYVYKCMAVRVVFINEPSNVPRVSQNYVKTIIGYFRAFVLKSSCVFFFLKRKNIYFFINVSLPMNIVCGRARNDVLRIFRGRVRNGRYVGHNGVGYDQRYYVKNVQAQRVHRAKLHKPVRK